MHLRTTLPRRSPLVLCAAAALSLLAACGPSKNEQAGPGAAGGQMPPMPVGTRSVKQQTVPILIDAVGQAEGSKEVEIRARVGGILERQLYKEGDRVKAGAPLFAIERAPYEIALAQARAALGQEQAKLEQARREAARLKPLAEMQAIARKEADDAATAQRTAEASVAAAVARVRDAELSLSYTAITSPIAGISGRAEKSLGSLVSTTDSLLSRVTQSDPIWVRFSFSEPEWAQLRGGGNRAAAVKLQNTDGKPIGAAGRLNFTGSTVDSRLGTVQLRAEFPNPDLAVLPGQFVRAQVQSGEQKAWLVPQAAVVSNDQGKAVWTVQGGKAVPTPVEVGGWVGHDWAVLKGLKDGDQVIVDNLLKLRPGAPVNPHDAAAAPGGPGGPGGPGAASAASAAPAASAASR